jgi:hypothetical protein
MSSCHFYRPSVIAYASLSVEGFDLEPFRKHCLDIPSEVDLYAEEVHPNAEIRPLWDNIFTLILDQQIHTLIVPSLYHIVGEDTWIEPTLLRDLNTWGIRLISLMEGFDSFADGGRFYPAEPGKSDYLKDSAKSPILKEGTDE